MTKIEELEGKIRKVVEELLSLRRETQRLRSENDSLKGHVGLLSTENSKAQRILAEYDQLKRRQEQAVSRVERALATINSLRS